MSRHKRNTRPNLLCLRRKPPTSLRPEPPPPVTNSFHNGAYTMRVDIKLAIFILAFLALGTNANAQSSRPPVSAPVMNEELMERLIKYTRADPDTGTLPARICKVLELCEGARDMPLKFVLHNSANGTHYFGV